MRVVNAQSTVLLVGAHPYVLNFPVLHIAIPSSTPVFVAIKTRQREADDEYENSDM